MFTIDYNAYHQDYLANYLNNVNNTLKMFSSIDVCLKLECSFTIKLRNMKLRELVNRYCVYNFRAQFVKKKLLTLQKGFNIK